MRKCDAIQLHTERQRYVQREQKKGGTGDSDDGGLAVN